MVQTGGLLAVIGARSNFGNTFKPVESNIYSICSKFPDATNGIEILFDGELRVHLMDG